jgi:hypothetical protein
MHQLTQFVAPDLRFEFVRKGGQKASPLPGNLTVQQVIENSGHVWVRQGASHSALLISLVNVFAGHPFNPRALIRTFVQALLHV